MNDRILLLRTGGTIDSERYLNPKKPPHFVETLKGHKSPVSKRLNRLSPQSNIDEFTWGKWREHRFVKDSQKFTEIDMRYIANIIKNSDHRYVVLTHGTDAMVKNATALQKELQASDKVVVIVGAMVPLSMHQRHKSDGVEALDSALEHIHKQQAGVHILGRDRLTHPQAFFDPKDVQKDRRASRADLAFTLKSR